MTEPYVPLQRVLGCVSIGGLVNKVEEDIRNLPRVELNTDGLIPCSIPQELVDAINNLLGHLTSPNYFWTDENKALFDQLKQALSKALQGQCTMHQSLQRQQELEEAEKLLTKVCEHIEAWPVSWAKYIINEEAGVKRVEGLKEWWTKRKPKSKREKKLDKIQYTIKTWWPDGEDRAQFRMAEEILKALENEV